MVPGLKEFSTIPVMAIRTRGKTALSTTDSVDYKPARDSSDDLVHDTGIQLGVLIILKHLN
jgi:hypothetical protein